MTNFDYIKQNLTELDLAYYGKQLNQMIFVARGREEQMVLNEFVEELDVAIKQDGHDIYCDAETAKMLKSLINDVEKPKRLHKICTIYATPPNDTKKVDELLKNTNFHIATGYDDNGKFRYEVFGKDPLK